MGIWREKGEDMKRWGIITLIVGLLGVGLFGKAGFSSQIDLKLLDEFIKDSVVDVVSMDLEGVPLFQVLKGLSIKTGLNFVAEKSIQNYPITLYVKDVSVKEFVRTLLELYDLEAEYRVKDRVLVIKKPKEEKLVTKVFELKYAVVPGAKILSKSAGGGQLTELAVGSGGEEGVGGLSGEGLFESLQAVLTEEGRAICDPRSNTILVTDVESNMPVIEKVIKQLDKPVPQVMIEVDMVDVSRSVVDKLGIEWPESLVQLTGLNRSTTFPFLGRDLSFWGGAEREGTLSSVSFGTWLLNFLITQTDAKYLARPRIFTLNGETAEISILTKEVIGITRYYDDDGGISTEEPERYNTGLFLEVTPLVNTYTKEITMVVVPKLVETKPSKIEGLHTEFRDPEERGVRSVVRVPDGATVVLGGLIKHVTNNTEKEVPGLGKILKGLFSSKNKESKDRELLVFLTPHLWESGDIVGGGKGKKIGNVDLSDYEREDVMERALKSYD